MKPIMFDIEADGFLESSTKIHCIAGKDIITGEKLSLYGEGLDSAVEYLDSATTLLGHNIIGYDFDMLEKYLGWAPRKDQKIVDTLVLSQTLNPDRQLPRGCPTSYKNPLTGKLDRITPHSVAAWGYRVSKAKPQHYDWLTFSPEMLHRCEEDVEIQELILHALLVEASISLEEMIR